MADNVELIEGVYCLSRNENFYEYLIAQGIEEDKARKIDLLRPIMRISLDGKDLTIITEMDTSTLTSKFKLDQEVEEKIALNMTIKSHTSIDDNKLKISSVGPDGEVGIRQFVFFESELIMIVSSDDIDVPEAKRFYKRM